MLAGRTLYTQGRCQVAAGCGARVCWEPSAWQLGHSGCLKAAYMQPAVNEDHMHQTGMETDSAVCMLSFYSKSKLILP